LLKQWTNATKSFFCRTNSSKFKRFDLFQKNMFLGGTKIVT